MLKKWIDRILTAFHPVIPSSPEQSKRDWDAYEEIGRAWGFRLLTVKAEELCQHCREFVDLSKSCLFGPDPSFPGGLRVTHCHRCLIKGVVSFHTRGLR